MTIDPAAEVALGLIALIAAFWIVGKAVSFVSAIVRGIPLGREQ